MPADQELAAAIHDAAAALYEAIKAAAINGLRVEVDVEAVKPVSGANHEYAAVRVWREL